MAAIVPNENHISDLKKFSWGLEVALTNLHRYDSSMLQIKRPEAEETVNTIFEKKRNMLHDNEYQILKGIFDGFKKIEIPNESEEDKVERLFETVYKMVGTIDDIIKEPLPPQGEPHVAAQPQVENVAAQPPVKNVAAEPPKEEEIEGQPPVQPQQPPPEDEFEPGLPKK
jgi:hypothetical protein